MAALDSIEIDDDARAVILTGAGERAFSAGTDIHEFATSDPRHERSAARLRPARTGHTSHLESFNKPTIAAINGLAFGDGCEITEAVHLAVASDRALFAKPEINLGMPPTFGGTQRLPRLAGRKRSLELYQQAIPFRRRGRSRSGWSTRWCRTTNCCRSLVTWPDASSGIHRSRSAASSPP
jgi:enoyl-CoA hydratase